MYGKNVHECLEFLKLQFNHFQRRKFECHPCNVTIELKSMIQFLFIFLMIFIKIINEIVKFYF